MVPLGGKGAEDRSDFLDDVECLLEVLENKNRLSYREESVFVPGAGIEPARIAPLVFETNASTNSAIRAFVERSTWNHKVRK